MLRNVIPVLLLQLLVPAMVSAETEMKADGSRLTVRTERYEIEFRGGVIVDLDAAGEDSIPAGPVIRGATLTGAGAAESNAAGTWEIEDGTAAYSKAWDEGTYTLRVRVDDKTGDLVLRHETTSREPGLRTTSWKIENLDLGGGRNLILPSSGGVSTNRDTLFRDVDYTYPFGWPDWSSQLAIIERSRDCVGIWSTDPTGRFKHLRVERRTPGFALEFQTENPAPFNEKTEARSVEWRVNVFDGDWRTAAGVYRDWMREAFDLVPRDEEVAWARRVRAVVGTRGRDLDPGFFDRLAERLMPKRTLIYVPDWRSHGYDVYYPDYTPGEYIGDFIDEAHRHGFHVMLHVNLPGISPRHPLYEEFKRWHTKDPTGTNLLGWYWEKQLPVTHAFINPAASKYRELYVSQMKDLIAATGADALHLDVSSPMWNDGNGLIEGMSYPQGSMALHRALKEALPKVVLGGESINEITLRGERFYQKWMKRGVGTPHPVESFLYGDFAYPVGYLGLPNPDESPGGYNEYAADYEAWGVLPTIFLDIGNPSQMDRLRTMSLLDEARSWQEDLLTPDFSRAWREDEKFVWKGRGGTGAVLEEEPSGSVRMRIGEKTCYERVRGCSEWETSLTIPDWPAFEGKKYIGIDPGREYLALPVPRGDLPLEIVRLPPGLFIRSFRADDAAALITLATPDLGSDDALALALLSGKAGTIIEGVEEPVQKGARFDVDEGPSQEGDDIVFASVCPWHPVGDEQDKAWGSVFLEGTIDPGKEAPADAAGAVLRFETAIGQSALKGDGSTFRVDVNGREVFSDYRRDTEWKEHSIPLDLEGGKIRIRLIVDPGPNNSVSYDLGLWKNPRIEWIPAEAGGGGASGGTITIRSRLAVTAASVPIETREDRLECRCAPGEPITLFFEPPFPVTEDVSLPEVPYEFGVGGLGVYIPDQRAWGSGSIESVTVEGRVVRGFSGHPPNGGRTFIRIPLRIEEGFDRPVLTFAAHVKPGAVTEGVGFSVLLNGREAWSWSTHAPGSREGRVPLGSFAGRPLLVELVTDSLGTAYFDWAVWADPKIEGGG